jgi:uncharacterized protein YggE
VTNGPPCGSIPEEIAMHRSLRAPAVAALAAFLLAGAAVADDDAGITVSGTGEVAAVPDTGHLSAGVTTEASTAAAAAKDNAAAMERVLQALEAAGIAKKDVQTLGYDISPIYAQPTPGQRGHPKIVGYRVSNQVAVRVKGIDKVGPVLDRLVAAGANEVNGISFTLADPTALEDDARRKALADARRKAELYAAAAGVKLGRLVRLRETGGGVPLPMARMAPAESMLAAPTPIAAGELQLSVSLVATYAIEP